MYVETFTPSNVMKPLGPYSHIAKAGPFVSISAIAGVDPATGRLAGPEVYAQAKQILSSLETLLESAGSSLEQVMHIHVFLKSMDDFEEMNRAYREAFRSHGVDLDANDWPRWHALEASARRWIEAFELGVDAETIRVEKKLIYEALVATELALKPGALALVEALHRQSRLCVASGSRPESIAACLERFDLAPYFEATFSATLLPRKKPYPDVYLEALAKTGVDAARALALEDSPTGLQAATTAGLRCVVCPDSFVPAAAGAFSTATLVVDSLEDLTPQVLERLLRQNPG